MVYAMPDNREAVISYEKWEWAVSEVPQTVSSSGNASWGMHDARMSAFVWITLDNPPLKSICPILPCELASQHARDSIIKYVHHISFIKTIGKKHSSLQAFRDGHAISARIYARNLSKILKLRAWLVNNEIG